MITFKKFFKSIGILNSSDQTKELEITVSDSQTSGAKVTLVSNATADRTITLPDGDGTLGFSAITLTANRAVVTDGSGNLVASSTSDAEIAFVDGVTSPIQTQLDNLSSDISNNTSDINDLQADSLNRFGTIALNNDTFLSGRDAANLNDLSILKVGATDAIEIGTAANDTDINADSMTITISSGGNIDVVNDLTIAAANINLNTTGLVTFSGSSSEISAGTKTIINVVDPVDPQDAATKAYVDSISTSFNPHPARYSQSTSQTVTTGSTTDINFPTEGFDPENLVTTTPFSYTVPETGYYQISSGVKGLLTGGGAVDTQISLLVRVNGSVVCNLDNYTIEAAAINNDARYVQGSTLISANSSDVITIALNKNTGSDITVTGNDSLNYVTVHFVGA